ncbi:DUF6802 family protein [Corynebacterium provencense]|uniref:DUF6802 family protein n=1 Tax=Corynebacterium provencense TaxID=1737425 RepID=UPI000A9B9D6C|nr:DUF6802 family protein [Corynebacterium provencense]MCI1255375.1 hypothetical protein [Corynebacterium provencense]
MNGFFNGDFTGDFTGDATDGLPDMFDDGTSGDGTGGGAGVFDGLVPVDGDSGGGNLVLDIDGVRYGLPPSHDLGEGALEEAVTLTGDLGLVVCADTDGDGLVDRLSVVGFDGSWSSWQRCTGEPSGEASSPGTPPVTPTGSTHNWTVGGWECVDRGGWG